MIFKKRPRSQGNKYKCNFGSNTIEHCKNYTYLGLTINAPGIFNLAVNELKEKARRAFYAIKMGIQFDIPIKIWLKIFKTVIESIVLYGSEVWGPLAKPDFSKWEKHPTESLYTEFCKMILHVQRKTPNRAYRTELGQYPLLINIEKRAIKFWQHLNHSDPNSYHYKALKCQELSIEKSPLNQLVLRLTALTSINTDQPQDNSAKTQEIRVNKIISQHKENYISYWIIQTQTQSKLNCYLAIKDNTFWQITYPQSKIHNVEK